MVNKTVIVKNAQGIHMRPAGILAAEMKKFPGCTVMLKTPDKTAKATAVMQIMAAGIKAGTAVRDQRRRRERAGCTGQGSGAVRERLRRISPHN